MLDGGKSGEVFQVPSLIPAFDSNCLHSMESINKAIGNVEIFYELGMTDWILKKIPMMAF